MKYYKLTKKMNISEVEVIKQTLTTITLPDNKTYLRISPDNDENAEPNFYKTYAKAKEAGLRILRRRLRISQEKTKQVQKELREFSKQ